MDHSVAANFHGVDYVLSWAEQNNRLALDLEDMHSASERWFSELEAKYVEDITRKTGNFKRFSVFCKMLVAAMSNPTDHLYADILTLHDLEMLKARQMRGTGGTSPSHQQQPSLAARPGTGGPSKRYLIVTYETQFDRVHYPLPLAPCPSPTPEMLMRTIQRLHANPSVAPQDANARVESHIAAGPGEADERVAELEAENERLREVLRKNKALKRKTKAVTAMSEEVQQQLEEERDQWIAEREVLEDEIEGLRGELDAMMAQDRQSARSLDQQTLAVNKENRVLREKVAALEQAIDKERESHRRVQDRRKRELENALQELNRLRASNRQLRARAKEGPIRSGSSGSARPGVSGGVARSTTATRARARANAGLAAKRTGPLARGRARSRSAGARSAGGRSLSSGRSRTSQGSATGPRARAKTRAVAGGGAPPRRVRSKSPRFDPTAYQREQEAKRKRLEQARKRSGRPGTPRSRDAGALRSSPSPRARGAARPGTPSSQGGGGATRSKRAGVARRLKLTTSGYISGDSNTSRVSAGSRRSAVSRASSRASKKSRGSAASNKSRASAASKSSGKRAPVSRRGTTPRSAATASSTTSSALTKARTVSSRPPTGSSKRPGSASSQTEASRPPRGQTNGHGVNAALVDTSVLTAANTVDTSVEMDDIDKRLAQLQTFLKQEKAKASFTADEVED